MIFFGVAICAYHNIITKLIKTQSQVIKLIKPLLLVTF